MQDVGETCILRAINPAVPRLRSSQYSCLGNPHGWRSLAGYSPWSHKESDSTQGLRNNSNAHCRSSKKYTGSFPWLLPRIGSLLWLMHYKYFKNDTQSWRSGLLLKGQELWNRGGIGLYEGTQNLWAMGAPCWKGGARNLGPCVQSLGSSGGFWSTSSPLG